MAKSHEHIDIITDSRPQFKSGNEGFGKQEIDLESTPLFFPKGFEKFFIVIYILTLPYVAGLLFTFIYLANSDYKLFLTLNKETPAILTWAIGYEILATLILIYIIKMAIQFSANAAKGGSQKNFKRPT